MRSRNIKPAFFKNEVLAEQNPYLRLLYIGLWCLADKQGLIENRPKRIKAELFPYEEIDINGYLTVMQRLDHVRVFGDDTNEYLYVVNFLKHQRPHHTEITNLPDINTLNHIPFKDNGYITVKTPLSNAINPPDSLLLIPDSLNPLTDTLSCSPKVEPVVVYDEIKKVTKKVVDRSPHLKTFEEFYLAYPKKQARAVALKVWLKLQPSSEMVSKIIASVEEWKKSDKWQKDGGQFVPMPSTFLNQQRWDDEIKTTVKSKWDGCENAF